MSKKYIEEQKAIYKKLQPCFCPALQEFVYFNSTGLNHLLYYRRRPRSHREKHYRASTIHYLVKVISDAKRVVEEIKSENPLVITWSLQSVIEEKNEKSEIKVILVKNGNGKIYFLSAMKKKYGKNEKRKNPA